jgi:hypothetical protein
VFTKGQKKVPGSGRKKGSKNKNHLPDLQEYLAAKGVNPIQEILSILRDKKTAQEHKLQGWKTILSYCYRKPTENSGTSADPSEGPLPLINSPELSTEELLQALEKDQAN